MPAEEGGQGFDRPPVAGPSGEFAHYQATAERPAAFVVVGGYAVIADMRVCERNYLAGVRRVRQYLLVAGHDGIEDHLSCRR